MKTPTNNSTVKSFRKQLKLHGYKARKAAKLHKRIEQLDKEAFYLVDDINAYFANRKACWALTSKLLSLEV